MHYAENCGISHRFGVIESKLKLQDAYGESSTSEKEAYAVGETAE
jgi:hypothetical protein